MRRVQLRDVAVEHDPPAAPDYTGDSRRIRSALLRALARRRFPARHCARTCRPAFCLRAAACSGHSLSAASIRLAPLEPPVATSSCRCSDPIMRPSDSAERSSSDSLSRVRSRVGCAGIAFLAIQSPLAGQVPYAPRLSKRRASSFRPALRIRRQTRGPRGNI
jgi:hypothetical protein